MATPASGPASTRNSGAIPNLEARSSVAPTQSTSDLVAQMLAHVRTGAPNELAPPAPADDGTPRPSPESPRIAALAVRSPPGPQGRPAPPALAGASAPAAPKTPQTPVPSAAGPAPFNVNALIDEEAPWLPPEPDRKSAFLQVFRYWHSQVRPENAAKATPAFLFLVTALPVMVQARDDLKALNLWEPPGEHSRQARDQHPAWKKYCEFLPRAQQALQELDAYRHLSLLTGLDDLNARVAKAEKRFREGAPPPPPRGQR